MPDSNRIKMLDQRLVTLGPKTYKQKNQDLPSLKIQCKAYRASGHHREADLIAEQIEALDAIIKAAEKELDAIEKELYSLRARQRHRNLRP